MITDSTIRLDATVSWSIVLESRAMSQFAKRVTTLGHFIRIYAVSCKNCASKLCLRGQRIECFNFHWKNKRTFERTLELFSWTKFHRWFIHWNHILSLFFVRQMYLYGSFIKYVIWFREHHCPILHILSGTLCTSIEL